MPSFPLPSYYYFVASAVRQVWPHAVASSCGTWAGHVTTLSLRLLVWEVEILGKNAHQTLSLEPGKQSEHPINGSYYYERWRN